MRPIDADALKDKFAVPGYEYFSPGYIRDSIDEEPTIRPDEPRVMTLDEIGNALKMPIWKETKSSNKSLYNGWVLAYDIQKGQGIMGTALGMSEPSGRVVWYRLFYYGRTWRCWTHKPTDEQRKAVKWDAAD
jgi:hypothetical protein